MAEQTAAQHELARLIVESLNLDSVTPEQIDQAKAILDDNDAIDVGERRAAYEAEGWTGFDENAKPKTSPGGPTNDSILPPFL